MADKVKVSVLETNGVEELEGPAERSLTADIVDLNPVVGGYDNVDDWIRNFTSSTSTDHHAGWHDIISGQIVEISSRKQMRIKGTLQNAGTIINNGILVVD